MSEAQLTFMSKFKEHLAVLMTRKTSQPTPSQGGSSGRDDLSDASSNCSPSRRRRSTMKMSQNMMSKSVNRKLSKKMQL
jgi:hypothetical protein